MLLVFTARRWAAAFDAAGLVAALTLGAADAIKSVALLDNGAEALGAAAAAVADGAPRGTRSTFSLGAVVALVEVKPCNTK